VTSPPSPESAAGGAASPAADAASLGALALEQAGVAILVVDARGVFCAFNREAERQLGATRAEMQTLEDTRGLAIFDLDGSALPPEEMPLARALRGEAQSNVRVRVPDGAGGRLTLAGVATPLRGEGGALIGAALYLRDVSEQDRLAAERARLLAAAEESRRRFELLAHSFPGTVLLYDRDLRFLLADGPGLTRLGLARASIEGKTLAEATSPGQLAAVEPYYRAALEGRVVEREVAAGELIFSVQHHPVRDGGGAVVGGMIVSLDVTAKRRAEAAVRHADEGRKQIEDALRQQTRLLETIMQTASLGLVMMDDRQRCTYMNPAAERIFGFTLDEVRAMDKPLHDIIHHKRADGSPYPIAECPIDRALPTRMRETGEDVFVRRDGSLYPVAFTASPILENERPIGTVIEVRDTSEERAAAARLRAQNETLEVLNEVGQQLQSELELDKLVQGVTDAATKLAGAQFGSFFYNVIDAKGERYTLYSISGVPREAFSRFPMPRNTDVFMPTFAGEGVVRVDDIKKDPRYGKNDPYYGMPPGHLPVASYLAVPVVSRSGEVIGGLFFGHMQTGMFTEQSERLVVGLAAQAAVAMDNAALYRSEQRAAKAAEFERARLRKLLAQLPAGVAVSWGPDHRFDWANDIYTQVAGRDVAGKTVRDAFPDLAGQPFFGMLDGVYQKGEPVFGKEAQVLIDRKRDGHIEQAYFDFVYQPILDAAGKPEGILTFCIEVTEQVVARQRVESLAADLSRAVAEERRAVTERERLIAKLEKTNKDLDQFAYVASHDLKAPLRGIASLSHWIEEDLAPAMTPEVRKNMDLLRGRIHRLEALIDGILQYSRAGRVRDKLSPVDVKKLCGEVWDMLAPPPSARLVLVDPLPELVTERVPLQQVLQNLIGNALKHGGGDASAVTVAAQSRSDDPYWELSVRDEGPGIAPEFHDRIWGIFQTLAARDRVEGTGIGLSVVRKLVESKGGRAWVESEPGRGATFKFTWPKHDAAPE
jgi:PAS domain S-box-containing protein